MWANSDEDAAMKFHEATPQWFSTWDGTNAAMQVWTMSCTPLARSVETV